MDMPWAKLMDEMDIIRAQTLVNGASRMLEDIASGYSMMIAYSKEESLVYLCESTITPGKASITRLAKDFRCNLTSFETVVQNPDIRVRGYTIARKNKNGRVTSFSVGVYEFPESPEKLGITHTVNRSEGLVELLNEVAKLYGIITGARLDKNVPADDANLRINGDSTETTLPKPFQQF